MLYAMVYILTIIIIIIQDVFFWRVNNRRCRALGDTPRLRITIVRPPKVQRRRCSRVSGRVGARPSVRRRRRSLLSVPHRPPEIAPVNHLSRGTIRNARAAHAFLYKYYYRVRAINFAPVPKLNGEQQRYCFETVYLFLPRRSLCIFFFFLNSL